MSDDQSAAQEEVATVDDKVDQCDSGAETKTPEQLNDELDRLYEKLPKLIGVLREDSSEGELHAAIKGLLIFFRKINAIEPQLLSEADRGEHKPISFTRIYELATRGGNESTSELQEANAAFAAENAALIEAIDSLAFQIKTLKRAAADEILGKGYATDPLREIDQTLANLKNTLSFVQSFMIEAGLPLSSTSSIPSNSNLDERLLEGLSHLSPISADLLNATPLSTTLIGRALRRAGFAYDHKDLSTIRQLVPAVLTANRKLAELYRKTVSFPTEDQIENLGNLLSLIELYAGSEERKGEQYREAMAEIARMRAHIDADAAERSLEEIEEKIATRRQHLEELEQAIIETQKRLEEMLRQLSERDDLKEKLAEASRTIEELRQTVIDLKKAAQVAQDAVVPEQTSQGAVGSMQTPQCTTQDDLERLREEHRREMAKMENYTQSLKDGLLVKKLGAEIVSLRNTARQAEEKNESLRAEKEAFEVRVVTWLQNPEDLQRELRVWRRAASIRLSQVGTAAAVAGLAGFFTGRMTFHFPHGLGACFATAVVCPSIAGVGVAFYKNKDKSQIIKQALQYGIIGATTGAAIATFGYIMFHNTRLANPLSSKAVHASVEPSPRLPDIPELKGNRLVYVL